MTPREIETLIDRGALFVCNHSGGKDSQAMYLHLREIVPADQLVVVHAHLPEVEWSGVIEHIEATIEHELHVVQSTRTFFEMVEARGMFPSPKHRQCTSDLKRTPIEKFIRGYLRDNPRFGGLVVNCMGLRAEESSSRAKRPTFSRNNRLSKAGREAYEWLPVHELLVDEVFGAIAAASQSAHWAYAAGMTRLSCVFCIMGSDADIRTAARLAPDVYQRYARTERRIDHTMSMPDRGVRRFLDEITGIPVEVEPEPVFAGLVFLPNQAQALAAAVN